MTCQESELLLFDSSAPPTAAHAHHLAACPTCRTLQQELAADQTALRQLAANDGIPDVALTELHNRVMARIPRRRTPWIASLAAAAAIIVTTIFLTTPPDQPVPPPPAPTVAAAKPPSFALTIPQQPKPVSVPIKATPPLMVKLETSDPNVVIYWIVDNTPTGELE